ncbi:hypothetical protein RYA05_05860 [Pseudomonas syringae pv. actinidiae]|nr:hypothetical protein [Pseudomonas syringae pv. actinidiae]
MKLVNDFFSQSYNRARNLGYLLVSLVCVVGVSCEPSVTPLRDDVAGLLMGMSVFSVLGILSIACSVLAGDSREMGSRIFISTLTYMFAYVILKDSGASLIDDILASPKKWLLFSLGGLISYLIFNGRSVIYRGESIISGSSAPASGMVKPALIVEKNESAV